MWKRIARILFEQWDPLGIKDLAPHDEYDDYARDIEAMLARGEGGSQLLAYLDRTRRTVLLMPADRSVDDRAAHAIIAALRS